MLEIQTLRERIGEAVSSKVKAADARIALEGLSIAVIGLLDCLEEIENGEPIVKAVKVAIAKHKIRGKRSSAVKLKKKTINAKANE